MTHRANALKLLDSNKTPPAHLQQAPKPPQQTFIRLGCDKCSAAKPRAHCLPSCLFTGAAPVNGTIHSNKWQGHSHINKHFAEHCHNVTQPCAARACDGVTRSPVLRPAHGMQHPGARQLQLAAEAHAGRLRSAEAHAAEQRARPPTMPAPRGAAGPKSSLQSACVRALALTAGVPMLTPTGPPTGPLILRLHVEAAY